MLFCCFALETIHVAAALAEHAGPHVGEAFEGRRQPAHGPGRRHVDRHVKKHRAAELYSGWQYLSSYSIATKNWENPNNRSSAHQIAKTMTIAC